MAFPPDNEARLRREIVETGKRLYSLGYVAATDGNISVRLDSGLILTTPTGMSKGFMEEKDIVTLSPGGKKIAGEKEPSSEIAMHLLIYTSRPEINAVVHAHPPTATGYAAAGIALNKALISEVVLSLGCVPLAPYGTPGTGEVTSALAGFVRSNDAVLMANHGAVTFAENLERAFWKMETVEHFAKISLVTEILGKQSLLSESDVDKLVRARVRYFGPRCPAARESGCPIVSGQPELPEESAVRTLIEEAVREVLRERGR